MKLGEHSFSDIILHQDGKAFLKGTDNHKVVPPKEDLHEEIEALHKAVLATEKGRHTFRLQHDEIGYRVAVYDGVVWGAGKVYFLRRVMDEVPFFEDSGYPQHIVDWVLAPEQRKGLILISGGQNDGKTTSASALIKSRLTLHGGHGISFENPVEMPLDGKHGEFGMCFQAEIESEKDLGEAIERSHRYASPDIIYIGEIRGKYAASETLRVCLGSANQLVVATIHGLNPIAALDRLIAYARQIDGDLAAHNLSQGVLGIIHQHLEGSGEEKALKVDDALFLPFPPKGEPDPYAGVRAKIKNGDISALAEDFNEQESRSVLYGRRTE